VTTPPTNSHGVPWSSRTLDDPGFDGDDGSARPELVEALAAGDRSGVVAVLLNARVLVAVVATLDDAEQGPGGRVVDKVAHMSVVTIRGADGRLALPVFSSTASLAAWDPSARPVPVDGIRAAAAAYDEGADALLVDPAGPVRAVLDGATLRALAEGRVPLPPAADPEVSAAVRAAAAAIGPPLEAVRLQAGSEVDVVVELLVASGTGEEDAGQAGVALGRLLAQDAVLRSRLTRGLDVVVVRELPASGHDDTPRGL
jgi:SseB protein N-terminal domain